MPTSNRVCILRVFQGMVDVQVPVHIEIGCDSIHYLYC